MKTKKKTKKIDFPRCGPHESCFLFAMLPGPRASSIFTSCKFVAFREKNDRAICGHSALLEYLQLPARLHLLHPPRMIINFSEMSLNECQQEIVFQSPWEVSPPFPCWKLESLEEPPSRQWRPEGWTSRRNTTRAWNTRCPKATGQIFPGRCAQKCGQRQGSLWY